jgi:hypothetical protein
MVRTDQTQLVVMASIVTRLKSALSLSENQCYETIEPLAPPVVPTGGDYFVTVALGHSSFSEGEQVIGNITEDATLTVTAYTRIRLDESKSDKYLFRDTTRGLLTLKKNILTALVGQDLVETSDPAEEFLRELLRAESSTAPNYDREKQIGWISIDFALSWDWNLS